MATKEQSTSPLSRREMWEQVRLNRYHGDSRRWGIYGEPIYFYDISFDGVLEGSIHGLLVNKPFPVVVDLMAPSETISTLFERFPDKPKLGLAISLEDLRSDEQTKRDAKLSIEQIEEDILKPSTWDKIEEKLRGRKADLIMERAAGGLDCIPRDPRIFALLLRRAWRLLSENNGILIAQLPSYLEIQAGRMINSFKNEGMDALIGSVYDNHSTSIAIKIIKTPNSPEKLPF